MLSEACTYCESREPKGEYVLVLEGRSRREMVKERQQDFLEMPVSEHVRFYEDQGMDRKAAMKQAAKDRGVAKREVYQALLLEE